jgi:hypothetical protein
MDSKNQNTLNRLIQFLYRDKFGPVIWQIRGIVPFDDILPLVLNGLFNNCTRALINALQKNDSPRHLKSILQDSLASIDRDDFESVERELIVDTYLELANIIDINFKPALNTFMHGSVWGTLLNLKPATKPARIIVQACTDCQAQLETLILREDKKEPDYGWNIIQCNHCGEYNLLHIGAGVKAIKFGRYKTIEELNRQDFTEQEAVRRLEQIRAYRKRS